MSNLVSIITCTGHRPEALALCQKFIERQTYAGEIQWIVVRDDMDHTPILTKKKNLTIEVFQGPRPWTPEYNTHRGNMEVAIKKIAGDHVFIMEDDDYYKPNFIEAYVTMLQHVEFVGLSRAKYYHVGLPASKSLANDKHASLSSTAVNKWGIPLLIKAIDSGDMYMDRALWSYVHEKSRPHALLGGTTLSIGMKGMPGRDGLTPSHRELRDYLIDTDGNKLTEWIGEDAKLYRKFTKKAKYESKKGSKVTTINPGNLIFDQQNEKEVTGKIQESSAR